MKIGTLVFSNGVWKPIRTVLIFGDVLANPTFRAKKAATKPGRVFDYNHMKFKQGSV